MKTPIAIKTQILPDAGAVAKEAARLIAAEARAAVAARGRFVMAVSGGHTPWQMLRDLANEAVPWEAVRVVQVDERIAPSGDPDRNLTHLRESLLDGAGKAGMLARLCDADVAIPAGRVRQDHALVIADRAAFGESD